VRRAGADPQVVVGLDDAVEPADRLEVDEDPGLAEAELQQGDQAVAAGEELGLAFSLVQDPDRLVEAPRPTYSNEAGIIARPSSSTGYVACRARGFRAGIGGDDRAVGRTRWLGIEGRPPGSALGS
jgi:hypothetical protein